jgi:hypothetical protein
MNVTTHCQPLDRPVVARGDPMNPFEVLVQARLDDIHADVDALRSHRVATRGGAPPGVDIRRLRVRIGRGLVAFGAALAGEERPARDQRAA